MLTRIILILGSIVGLVISVVVLVMCLYIELITPMASTGVNLFDVSVFVFMIFCIIFFTLNTYNVLSGRQGHISLYFKRKRLEEEIKIQEAKNRFKALQKKLEEEEKEKK